MKTAIDVGNVCHAASAKDTNGEWKNMTYRVINETNEFMAFCVERGLSSFFHELTVRFDFRSLVI